MTLVKLIAGMVVIVVFLAVWRIESKWRLILTPFLLVMYFEFVRVLPAFFVADTYGFARDEIPLVIAGSAFLAVIVGFVCVYFFKPTSPDYVLRLSQTPDASESIRAERLAVLGLAAMLVGLGLYFYGGIPSPVRAVAGLLTGGGGELAVLVSDQRFALTKGAYFGEAYRGQGLITAVQRIGWALVCSYTIVVAMQRCTAWTRLVAALSILCAWVFVAGDGTRATFLNLLIVVTAAYSLRRALTFRFVAVAAVGIVVLAIGLGMYSAKMYFMLVEAPEAFLRDAAVEITERIVLGNALNDVRVIELINDGTWAPRWGETHVRKFVTALPGVEVGVPLAHDLFVFYNPQSSATTFWSGTYLSDVYVDFSWYGVVPIFLIVGGFIGVVQRAILLLHPSPWSIAIAATVGFYSAMVMRSGFSSVIVSYVVIITLVGLHSLFEVVIKQGNARPRVAASPGFRGPPATAKWGNRA